MRESTLESVAPSMPTFATLESWARSSIRDLLQRVLEEEVTEFSGTDALPATVCRRRHPRLPQRIRQTATGVVDVGHHRGETAARSGIGRAL